MVRLVCLTLAALGGCQPLCKNRPTEAEVKVTLAGSVKEPAAAIKKLKVIVTSAALDSSARPRELKLQGELTADNATFIVRPEAQGGFGMKVWVEAYIERPVGTYVPVASGEQAYTVSGDACNFFILELKPTPSIVDGGPDLGHDGSRDRGPEQRIDAARDKPPERAPADLQLPRACAHSGLEFEATQPLTPGQPVQVFVGTDNPAFTNWVLVGIALVPNKDCATTYVQPAESDVQHGNWKYNYQWRFENVPVPSAPPYYFSWLYNAQGNSCSSPTAKVISCLAK